MSEPSDEIEHLQALVTTYRRRLRILERQIANFGQNVPAHIIMEREDVQRQLRAAEIALRRVRPTESQRQPYIGLTTFQEWNADIFFGREELVAELTRQIERSEFLAVLGPSGSGKSSIVRAGLIPDLKGGVLPGSEHWRYLIIKPGHRPLDSLAVALATLRGDPAAVVNFSKALLETPRALTLLTASLLADKPDTKLVLVIDQAEELWTLLPADPEQRRIYIAEQQLPFILNIIDSANSSQAVLRTILTMRADFLHRAAEYSRLAKYISAHLVLISPMNTEELREAIERPAELLKYDFDEGLVDELIHAVQGQSGALPLLQYTLLELWRQRTPDGVLTWQVYRSIGGVEGALSVRADTLLKEYYADETQQDRLRRILLRLVQPGEGTADTRRRARLVELVPAGSSTDELLHFLKPLTDERLLTSGQDEISGQAFLEISHEALIRAWPTYGQWIESSRSDLRFQMQVAEASNDWIANNAEADFLWSGLRLATARAWLERAYPELNEGEKRFLDASTNADEQRRARAEAEQREHEALLEARATAERKRAEEEARFASQMRNVNRRLRVFLGMIIVFLAGAVALGIFSYIAQQKEVQARLVADQARTAAERQTRIALARQLASQATVYSDRDRQLGLLLAMNAVSTTLNLDGSVEPDADRSLRKLLHGTSDITMTGGLSNVLRATFDSSGNLVAGGGLGLRIWNAHTGELLHVLDGHGQGSSEERKKVIQSVSFDNTGDRLLSAGWDGTARIWDVATGRQLFVLRGFISSLTDAVFSPDGTRVAAAGLDHYVILWNAVSGQQIQRMVTTGSINDLAYSPDGRFLAAGGAQKVMSVWDGHTGKVVFEPSQSDADAYTAVAFSPDSSSLAGADSNGHIFIWDTQTGKLKHKLIGHRGLIWQMAYSADGRRIATAGDDYTARVWNVETGEEELRLTHTSQTVRSVAFRPDGNQVATGSNDNVVRLWNANTGAQEGVLREDLFRASSNATVQISAEPGNIVASSDQPLYWVLSVAYNPTGDRVLSAGADEVEVSVSDPHQLLARAQSEVTRSLTCEERALFLNEKNTCSTDLVPPSVIPTK